MATKVLTKQKRLAEQKAIYEAMSKEDLRNELCKTLVGTLMPLLEMVVEKRVSQWLECIDEGLHKNS